MIMVFMILQSWLKKIASVPFECISNCRFGLKSIISEFWNNPAFKAGVIGNYSKGALAQKDHTRRFEMHPAIPAALFILTLTEFQQCLASTNPI